MNEVFINYRNGDGEEAAAALDAALSARFGADAIFRAPKSIPPGQTFQDALTNGVRRCSVLLSIMGPDWTDDPRLQQENDWVRREILEAFANGIPVMPVLKGWDRKRLQAADLPEALERLADLQSLRLNLRGRGADLAYIGDVLAERVPALRKLDRQAEQPSSETAHNSATGNQGPVLQGDGFDSFNQNHGQFHFGSGDNHQNTQHYAGNARHYSGNTQNFSRDGATYFQGDNQGNVSHRFGRSSSEEDER